MPMKRIILLLAAYCCICPTLLPAQETVTVPLIPEKTAPVMDGMLSEDKGEWKYASVISGFNYYNPNPQLIGDRTGEVYLSADSKNIYIAIKTSANNNDPGGGLSTLAKQRDGEVYNDDSVELTFATAPDAETGYHIIANRDGVVFDRTCHYKTGNFDVAWNCPGLKIGSLARGGFWVIELTIPRSSIGNPKDALYFNIARNWKDIGASALYPTRNHLSRSAMIRMNLSEKAPAIRFPNPGLIASGKWMPEVSMTALDGTPKVYADMMLRKHAAPDDKGEPVASDGKRLEPGGKLKMSHTTSSRDLFSFEVNVRDESGNFLLRRSFFARKGQKGGDIPSTLDFDLPKIGSVMVYHYPSKDKAVVVCSPDSDVKIASIHARLGNGKPVAMQQSNGDWNADLNVPAAPGRYPFEFQITFADGKSRTIKPSAKLEKKHFPWLGNNYGKAKIVLPPFTPIRQTGKNTLGVLLNEYTFSNAGLPSSVRALGREMLSKEIFFEISSNGHTARFNPGTLTVKRDGNGYSAGLLSSAATPNGVRMNITGNFEYDGFLWNDVKLTGTSGKPIDRLTLIIPLKDSELKYFHAVACDTIRRNPSRSLPKGQGTLWTGAELYSPQSPVNPQFVPYLWLGAEKRGLCFFMDTSFGTKLDTEKPAVRIVHSGDTVFLEVDIINRPVRLKEGHSFGFGLMATPVKDADPRLRQYFQSAYPRRMKNMNTVMELCEHFTGYHNRWARVPFNDDWKSFDRAIALGKTGQGYTELHKSVEEWDAKYLNDIRKLFAPLPDVGKEKYAEWWINCRNFVLDRVMPEVTQGTSYMKYSDPTLCTYLDPNVDYFKSEWISRKCGYMGAVRCFLVPSYMDYIVDAYRQEIERGLWGMYMDDMFLITCRNPETAAKIDDEGILHPATGILPMRELVKRVSVLQHEHGMTPRWLQIHMTNALIVPSFSLATSVLGWEDGFGESIFQSRFPLDYIMTESLGTQIGAESVACDGIHRQSWPEDTWPQRFEFITRTQFAVMLPNGVKPWQRLTPPTGGIQRETLYRVFDILGSFGIWKEDCQFVAHYESDGAVTGQPENVLLSTYRRPGQTLIVMGNLGKKATFNLAFDRKKLGVPEDAVLYNRETGERLPDGKITLGDYDFAMLLLCKELPKDLSRVEKIKLPEFEFKFAAGSPLPRGWALNNAAEFKPFGTASPITIDGCPGVKLTSNGKFYSIFAAEQIPARTGDVFHVTATVHGKGLFMLGFYQYGSKAKWQWRGIAGSWARASVKPGIVSQKITITASDVKNVCLALSVQKDSETSITDVKVEKIIPSEEEKKK